MQAFIYRERFHRAMLAAAITGTLCVGTILLTGCGTDSQSLSDRSAGHDHEAKEHEHGHIQYAVNGDLQETTESLDVLPSFLSGLPDEVSLAYQTAATLRSTLESIPCYCGCGGSAGHRSNLDCFIHEIHDDGSVVWDDHGTKCDVCIETAFQTALMLKEGKSVKEIRISIDDSYKTGYAAPTPTPMPS
ncbi:PCYCGC domain-containing protein [Paenibacillus xylaniclasticus]|uniref:PCYCGC domain-containing protein n=1 Tax=Paenibacillus xylaniclasticus TaxID=588083 RepID=UPI00177662A4|nr:MULTISPECIES: PCYCGC domain-containing protein [Paenibacillus]GFN31749.1 hypothetical protein PCURB6_20090 [Paenibacillus curdlanolyticus]